MCLYSSPPSQIYREEQWGLHAAIAVGESLRTDIGKLLAKARGRWGYPLVGLPVGSADWWAPSLATTFGQEASKWVPFALTRA